ncbi:MBL fold metallo-hydrolase [Paucilactobacillus suebicus]|uniref:Metallo-beta-lactamase superfamily protein n=1 Tax=Paucilactobacillus suebicus DSM 5007 = KCTC 3549 TaxID=1423807 RepID=A0A0R1WEX2_9LACO|nr:metallo-beta-lactamase superfamily protein [Paucilactobacillus suebicus DSM 5007 = KCTC 3549]
MQTIDDQLHYSILASGSTGNVTYLETPEHKILIDAGLSGKKIQGLMEKIGRSLTDVDALFVTHEHTDHIKGVGVLARKYGMNVYANHGTWDAMSSKIGKVPVEQQHILEPGKTLSMGDMDVESFAVSHDAAEPQFYQVHHDGKTFCDLTDTGYVSDRVEQTIKDADAYLIECNHDMEMLRMGPYAWPLKQRILGDEGHLSNEDGANTMMSVIGNQTKQIFLGHRSQENNMRSLAHLTVTTMMEQHDFGVDHDFHLHDTEPDAPTKLYTL